MSQDQPPAPPGQKWIKSWFGFGPWVLVEDAEFPLPPAGYRYQPNFHTGKPELVRTHTSEINAVEGLGSTGADRNIKPQPAQPINTQGLNFGTPEQPILAPLVPITESGRGIDGLRDDLNPDKGLLALKAKARKIRELQAEAYVNSD